MSSGLDFFWTTAGETLRVRLRAVDDELMVVAAAAAASWWWWWCGGEVVRRWWWCGRKRRERVVGGGVFICVRGTDEMLHVGAVPEGY